MLNRFRNLKRILQDEEEARRSGDAPERPDRALLAYEVTVATFDPERGKFWTGSVASLVYAGALLIDLVREGRIVVTGTGKNSRVEVVDPRPVGNELLDDTLMVLRAGIWGKKVTRNLGLIGSPLELIKRLVDSGAMTVEENRVLGFTRRRHVTLTDIGYDELGRRLRSVLSGADVPDERTALLVALLRAGGCLGRWSPKRPTEEDRARLRTIIGSDLIGAQEEAILSALVLRLARARES